MHPELVAQPAARVDLERVLAREEPHGEVRLDVLEVGEVDLRLVSTPCASTSATYSSSFVVSSASSAPAMENTSVPVMTS